MRGENIEYLLLYFRNTMAVFAAIYFILSYKRVKGYHIGFPLYFYLAFFPYEFHIAGREITDYFLKGLLLLEIFLLLKDKRAKIKICLYPMLLVLVIIGSGMIASSYSEHFVLRSFLTGIVNVLFIFYLLFLLLNRVKSQEGIEVIFTSMYRNGVFLCICAIIEKYVFHYIRVELSMHNANYFAFYLAVILCVAIYYKKWYMIPIVLFGIYFSKSVAVMLGLVLCSGIYILSMFMYRKKLTYVVMTIIPIISILVLWLMGTEHYADFDVITRLIAWKDPARLGIWTDGIGDFLAKPLFGYGYNCWLSYSTRYLYLYVSHNDLLRIMVECGIVGVITFGFGWIFITRKIAKSTNAILYLSLIAVIAMFSCLHNNLNSYMCWLFATLVMFDKFIPRGNVCSNKKVL